MPSMFHANAWGLPHGGWWKGCDLIFPMKFLQSEHLAVLINKSKPTFAGGVPTIWNDLLLYGETHPINLSSLRMVVCGGSAVPRSLIEKMQTRHGVYLMQLYGMTETGPIFTISKPPRDFAVDDIDWRIKQGRVVSGCDCRIVDDKGNVLPNDGKSVGEIQMKGPWVTTSYYHEPHSDKFQDGWLRSGDVGTLDSYGFLNISDRHKDVIKSGGEWISSVEVENTLMGHPDVVEAAVVAIPDDRWDERPLACVVLKKSSKATADDLYKYLGERLVKWSVPEKFTFINEVPKTSVGKFNKKVLRQQYTEKELKVVVVVKAKL